MNINNLAQRTNYIAGSEKFKNIPFYLTSVNIPGINLSHIKTGARNSSRVTLSADTVTFNTLAFDMLVDEDFVIYKELMDIISENIDFETGTYNDVYFDFWIELNNNKGNNIMKFEFHNCRLASLSDIILDTQDDSTEYLLTIEMEYDYFKRVDTPTLTLRV